MTALPRILQITHGHTQFHPGGTEMVALALHRHWRAKGLDCWYLGAAEPAEKAGHPGTNMVSLTPDQREAVIHTDGYSRFKLEPPDYFGPLREFANYLDLLKPGIVHFHHVLNLGLEAIHIARAVLPHARIVLTLHDYYLICANNGQLFKYHANERCMGPRLRHCMACIPSVPAEEFRMRELDIRRTLALVDQLVSPSAFLADRMRAGIENCPPIAIVQNTYVGPEAAAAPQRIRGKDFVFGYFGNLSRVKGAGDLLAAAALLLDRGAEDFAVHVNGSQLFADSAFEEQLAGARAKLGGRLHFLGRYEQDDIAARMSDADCVVFPSLWWENAPLVIYEALHHGRTIVSYPHGGAAEILKRHETGILAAHTRPDALADAMQEAMERNVSSITRMAPSLPSLANFAAAYEAIYRGRRNAVMAS